MVFTALVWQLHLSDNNHNGESNDLRSSQEILRDIKENGKRHNFIRK